jgi:hypothetical protein
LQQHAANLNISRSMNSEKSQRMQRYGRPNSQHTQCGPKVLGLSFLKIEDTYYFLY